MPTKETTSERSERLRRAVNIRWANQRPTPSMSSTPTDVEIDWVLAERDLGSYVKQAWPLMEPTTKMLSGWHIDAICDHLQAITNGEIKDLIINVPPGHMKSLTVSVFWPTWEWGPRKMPHTRWLTTSHGFSLATRDALKSRRVIQSWWYQERWGGVFKLTGDQNTKSRYENDKTGHRIALSVLGGATGERGDRITCDDPHDIKKAESDRLREQVTGWWDEVMSGRRNDEDKSARVIIMQRAHHDDLAGHVMRSRHGYVELILPERHDPKRVCTTRLGFKDPRKTEDELLWPAKFPERAVSNIRHEIGELAYAGQRQQRPVPREGAIFKEAWWQYYVVRPPIATFDTVIQSWDMAFKDLRTSDYVAGQVWGLKGADRYLLDRICARMSFVETLAAVKGMTSAWPQAHRKYVEDAANGPAVISALRHQISGLIEFNPNKYGSKVARAHAVTPEVESGNVYLPSVQTCPWVEGFIGTCMMFPRVKNDDDVDAMTQALLCLQGLISRLPANFPSMEGLTKASSYAG